MLNIIRGGNFSILNVIIYLISTAAVIFITLPIHEWAHGFAATRLGDPTPKWQGRLSLNPLAHLDPIGAISILLFGFGWARPVQINPRYFKNVKAGMAITALAGPLANLVMALASVLIGNIGLLIYGYTEIEILYYIAIFFSFVASINISLAVFNLIPIPPLDGSRLLGVILPDRIYYRIMQYERYLFYVVLLLLATDVLTVPLALISGLVKNLYLFLSGLVFPDWVVNYMGYLL